MVFKASWQSQHILLLWHQLLLELIFREFLHNRWINFPVGSTDLLWLKWQSTLKALPSAVNREQLSHAVWISEGKSGCVEFSLPPPPPGDWNQFFWFQLPPINFSCPSLSYRYCDTLYIMWQMNHRDCNKKVDCKWKKSTVTISAYKDLQSLIVTVDFFHLQLTFFTGTGSYSWLFATISVVHLPHFV